jgi:hypothetical protein
LKKGWARVESYEHLYCTPIAPIKEETIQIEVYTGDQYGREAKKKENYDFFFVAADCDKKRYNYTRTHAHTHIELIY